MKTVTGYLAILFGSVGVLITLAVIVATWWVAFEIANRVQQVSKQVDQSLAQVEDGLARVSARLNSTAEKVEKVRVSAEAARELVANAATKAEVERIRNTLIPLLERVDSLNEALPPAAQLLDSAAMVIEQTGQQKARAEKLRSVASRVREAATLLTSIRDRVAALHRGQSPLTARLLSDLAERVQRPLDLLIQGLDDVQEQSEDLRGELPKIQRTVNAWKILGPLIATALLTWIGLGQLSLVGWGRRRLASQTPPTPPASPIAPAVPPTAH